jgi:prepilin-type N-terminal cleavage/methylation domain-containing protein
MRSSQRGFSLLETLIAASVMLVAMTGAIAGLTNASSNITMGQAQQYKGAMAESFAQLMMLKSRALVAAQAVAFPATRPDQIPEGGAPWIMDTAGLFRIPEGGQATAFVPGTMPTGCNDSVNIKPFVYCREYVVTKQMPDGAMPTPCNAASCPPAAAWPTTMGAAYTVWVRVNRMGDRPEQAVILREVIFQ